ncbi:MAG TPA: sugar phosphate isomerase/epimerase [Opitutus sp.]|nr:sugar phosphate isomerase/epimerase [Opitutus sp.]
MKNTLSRFFLGALLAASVGWNAARAAENGPKLGIQTWTCRDMDFDQVVAFAEQHGVKYLEMIAKHIDPKGPREETLRKKAILDQHGLVCYSFGVNGTSMDKEDNRKLFEFAKLMGISVIVVEPHNMAEWDNLEQLVKEYDIRLAIHNHGTGSTYGDPATVQKVLAARDPRIGVCLDVGWVTAAGFDAAKVFRDYHGRVFDMHLKDKKAEMKDGKTKWEDVPVGTGEANLTGLFAEVKKEGWSGVMAIETDSGELAKDPARAVEPAKALFAKLTK